MQTVTVTSCVALSHTLSLRRLKFVLCINVCVCGWERKRESEFVTVRQCDTYIYRLPRMNNVICVLSAYLRSRIINNFAFFILPNGFSHTINVNRRWFGGTLFSRSNVNPIKSAITLTRRSHQIEYRNLPYQSHRMWWNRFPICHYRSQLVRRYTR